MKKLLSIVLLGTVILTLAFASPALAADVENGGKIFNANCAACHIGGGNLVMKNKTLKKDALEKYGMKSVESITYQVTNGKNSMPAFKGRLSKTQIEDVASYVLDRAESGW